MFGSTRSAKSIVQVMPGWPSWCPFHITPSSVACQAWILAANLRSRAYAGGPVRSSWPSAESGAEGRFLHHFLSFSSMTIGVLARIADCYGTLNHGENF